MVDASHKFANVGGGGFEGTAISRPRVGVHFNLGKADTRYGEVIRVVGANAALGGWDPQGSVALSTDPASYPRWITSQVVWLFPTGTMLEYKYLRDRRALGEGIAWEECIPNRQVALPLSSKNAVWLVKDQAWNCPGSQGAPMAIEEAPAAWAGAGRNLGAALPGEDDHLFTPTWRTLSCCEICPPECTPLSLSKVDSQEDTTTPVDASKPLLARELSILSLGMQRNQSCLSLMEPPESPGEASPRLVRELSVCSLTRQRVGSAISLSQAGCAPPEEAGPIVPEDTCEAAAPEYRRFEDAYEVIGENPLGEGSFGLVWGCRPRGSDAEGEGAVRAVKRVLMSKLLPRDVRNLFGSDEREGEIRMHLSLQHPHIIRLHEIFQEPDTMSLVMECCWGGDLFDIIDERGSGLPELSAATVMRHVLLALAFLHSHSIVHRDVKCENILMLTKETPIEQNTFKLCDFGFATRLQVGMELSTRMGSPDNVAPEIARGDRYSTPVDCWAAGVLLYMALSARPPFWARTDIDVLRRVRTGEYSLTGGVWEHTSQGAKDLVASLMTFVPKARIAAKEALDHLWFAA